MKGMLGKRVDWVIMDELGRKSGTVDIDGLLNGAWSESPSLTAMARRIAGRLGYAEQLGDFKKLGHGNLRLSAIIGEKSEGMRPVIIYDETSRESAQLTVKSPQYLTAKSATMRGDMQRAIEEIVVMRRICA